ncbi:MAG TPA: SUMF1/EgtB/PvdO family nonheme iron enzyme [bacterium]|nr:SUMF1/EgtB/PvdO family nonheme iron enzyme [bacterium]
MTISALLIFFISAIISGCSDNKTNQTDNEGVISDEDGYVPLCGNGFLDETEFCDSKSAKCSLLEPEKYRAGIATCLEDCSGYDFSECLSVYECGNSIVEQGEVCDGNFKLCSEIDPDKYTMGFASCFGHCNGWDSSKCKDFHMCGNEFLEQMETCEIGQTKECAILYPSIFATGEAVCNEYCTEWNISSCIPLMCNDVKCGSIPIEIDGTDHIFNCGTCFGGDICNSSNRCEFPCSDSKCGEVKIVDSDGITQTFECRECSGMQYCDTDNQCKSACSDMACGTDKGIDCGTCPDGYYCGPFPNRCKPKPKIEFTDIPGGTFFMGCNDVLDNNCAESEKPGHIIELSPYSIATYEITVAQYETCIEAGFCRMDNPEYFDYKTYILNFRCNIGSPRGVSHPANCISYYGAEAFCKFIGARLPTEAQWEKAARGGCEFYENCEAETQIFPWGNEMATCDTAVMMDALSGIPGCETGGTMFVGSKPMGVSPYGLFDMSGNAWEWTSDWFDPGYYNNSLEKDPQGPETGREKVLKGGSCNFSSNAIRPSYRYNVYPNVNYTYGGFRCVKTHN